MKKPSLRSLKKSVEYWKSQYDGKVSNGMDARREWESERAELEKTVQSLTWRLERVSRAWNSWLIIDTENEIVKMPREKIDQLFVELPPNSEDIYTRRRHFDPTL